MSGIRDCSVAIAGCFLLSATAASQQQLNPDSVLLEIETERVTVGDFLAYLKLLHPHIDFSTAPQATQRRELDEYLERRLLAIQARKLGLDMAPGPRRQIEFFTDGILADALRKQTIASIDVSQREMRAYYEENRHEFEVVPRLLLEHVIYSHEAGAKLAHGKFIDGADYRGLVAAQNRDPNLAYSRRGWITADLLIAEIANPVMALEPGGVTPVLKSPYGFHVLRLAEREAGHYRAFKEAQGQIVEKLQRLKSAARHTEMLEDLRRMHNVKVHLDVLQSPNQR